MIDPNAPHPTGAEKRSEPRYAVAARVLVQPMNGPLLECAANDISAHGMYLEMSTPLAQGTVLKIGPPGFEVQAKVAFVLTPEQAPPGRTPGVGVQLRQAIDPDAFLLACSEAAASERGLAIADAEDVIDVNNLAGDSSFSSPSSSASPSPSLGMQPQAPVSPGKLASIGPATTSSGEELLRRAVARRRAVAERVGGQVLDGAVLTTSTRGKVAEIVLVDGVPAQALSAALTAAGKKPLLAKHGFEAIVLCMRRTPVAFIATAHGDPTRLRGQRLVDEVRASAELREVRAVLIDTKSPNVGAGVTQWRETPRDVAAATRLVATLGELPPRFPPEKADDARALARLIADLGRRLDADGEHEAAVVALRYASELAPTVSANTILLARLLMGAPEQKLRDEAAALVERVIRQEPRAAEAYFLRAVVLDRIGKKGEAKASLERSNFCDPGNAWATAGLADLEAGRPLLDHRGLADAPGATEAAGEKRGWLSKLFGR